MELNNIDVKKHMSYQGYSLRKENKIHQSYELNFGKPTEIQMEIMVCERCGKDCRTANIILEPQPHSFNHVAIYGVCVDCNMSYFRK